MASAQVGFALTFETNMDFAAQLRYAGLSPKEYLASAKARAKAAGYDENAVAFSTRPLSKLQITAPSGKITHFGRAPYGDFLIYQQLERQGKFPAGFAEQKQRAFHASHSRIRGAWRDDAFSPNSLALAINW